MSLTDALLLEAQPLDVWIAARTDGVKGSGTQSDPYDGSTRPYPAVGISSLTSSGTTATATTTGDHHFADQEWVTISGVQVDPTAHASDVYYLGTFQIHVTGAQSFTYQMLYASSSSPAPGLAEACCREREQFDTLMRAMPENTAVHLGPGVFETKGLAFSIKTWEPKSGQKILGSGIGVTTLKLVGAGAPETAYWAIAPHYQTAVHDVEVADFTIDCNSEGQPNPYVTCGAVILKGPHMRIRRIRAVNFGSHTRGYVECFVISSGATFAALDQQGRHGEDCVIEDCIAERPSPNPVNNSSILMHGGGETAHDGVQAYHRGCAIRNCYVNGEIMYGTSIPLPINSISYDAATHVVTVTTRAPHLLTRPGNAVVRGVTVNGNPSNLFNGVFEVASVESATVFKYELVTTDTPDGSSGFVGGGVSTIPVPVERIAVDDALEVCPTLALHDFQVYENTYILTTRTPHGRTRNNNLRIYSVSKPGGLPSEAFNGCFEVDDYIPARPTEVQYTLLREPDADAAQLAGGVVNTFHQALSADNGTGAVVEGNRVFHCYIGGPYHDTWSSKEILIRNNYYHDVVYGPHQSLGGISTSPYSIPLVSLDHDGMTAKARTAFPHGLLAGERVTISSAGDNAKFYNGTWRIDTVRNPISFEYTMSATSEQFGPAQSPGYRTYEIRTVETPIEVTDQKRVESLFYVVRDGKKIVTAKTTYPKHGFLVGEMVRIRKAGHFNRIEYPLSDCFDGVFEITAVPNEKTFEYELDELTPDPGVDSENEDLAVLGVKGIRYCQAGDAGIDSESEQFAAGYFGKIWQTHSLVIENNVIELAVRPNASAYGIRLLGYRNFPPAYPFVEAIIRRNIVRNANDESGPLNRGIEVTGCETVLIERNVIGGDRTHPIEHAGVGTINTFNNTSPGGELIRSYVWQEGTQMAPEVVVKVRADLEDAMISAFLKSEED